MSDRQERKEGMSGQDGVSGKSADEIVAETMKEILKGMDADENEAEKVTVEKGSSQKKQSAKELFAKQKEAGSYRKDTDSDVIYFDDDDTDEFEEKHERIIKDIEDDAEETPVKERKKRPAAKKASENRAEKETASEEEKKDIKTSDEKEGSSEKDNRKRTVSGRKSENEPGQDRPARPKNRPPRKKKPEKEPEEEFFDDPDDAFEEDERDLGSSGSKKGKKTAVIVLASIIGVLAAVYIGFSVFFMSHFYFNTTINGNNFSAKTVADVEKQIEKNVQGYKLTLKEAGGATEVINGTDIGLTYVPGKELKKALDDQNAFLWVTALFSKKSTDVTIGVEYDEAKLTEAVNTLNCLRPENQTASANASPVYDGNQYTINPEVQGTQIDTEKFQNAVKEHITGFQSELDMTKDGIYIAPAFTQESQQVTAARDMMNQYINASITYTFGDAAEVVDRNLISTWLGVDENMNVVFNTDAVGAYLQELASRYNTVGTTRTITTPTGKTTNVSGGTYGWQMDYDTELQNLIGSIQAGEVTSREPAYTQTAASHGANDWGDTYLEVDLTNQYMWYVSGGAVQFETAVVTGKPDPEHETPEGVYSILEKKRDKTLRGAKQPDGSYEYETPVSYWLRVTWTGVGFHDATWQPSFGGDRYLNNGSHGCINMAYSDVASIYDVVQMGTPVVMHY